MARTVTYRWGNYRATWFDYKGSMSEEAYPQLLIVKPIAHLSDLAKLPYMLHGRILCQQL